MNRDNHAQSGYIALLAVLIIGAATLAIGLALLSLGTDSQRTALVGQRAAQARAVAASCADEALQQLHDNVYFLGTNNLAVGQGTCTYTVGNGVGGSTLMGLNTDAGLNGTQMSGNIDATSYVASATGTVSTLFALIGASVGTSPNDKGQMAIYSGATPTTLMASSAAVTLTANTWNAFPITPVAITSGTTYWLSYNANGLNSTDNNVRQRTIIPNQSRFVAQTYNTWPASWAGTASNYEMSVYAMIDGAGAGQNRIINVSATVGGVVRKVQVYATIGVSSISVTSWQEVI